MYRMEKIIYYKYVINVCLTFSSRLFFCQICNLIRQSYRFEIITSDKTFINLPKFISLLNQLAITLEVLTTFLICKFINPSHVVKIPLQVSPFFNSTSLYQLQITMGCPCAVLRSVSGN